MGPGHRSLALHGRVWVVDGVSTRRNDHFRSVVAVERLCLDDGKESVTEDRNQVKNISFVYKRQRGVTAARWQETARKPEESAGERISGMGNQQGLPGFSREKVHATAIFRVDSVKMRGLCFLCTI